MVFEFKPLFICRSSRPNISRRQIFNFVLMLCVAMSISSQDALAENAHPSKVKEKPWSHILPYFTPPTQWENEFGHYQSPLQFANGKMARTPEDWSCRRVEILNEWHSLMGQWPPINSRPKVETLQTERRGNLLQIRIRFKWMPNEFTTGYMLIPEGASKCPAVLTVYYEPETAIGMKDKNLDFAYQLACRGFVTLSIGTTDATNAGTYALYYPDIDKAKVQPLSMLAYAAANAWHVLAARPEVDPQRIGIVGHSFGGKWAMFAACLFDRFAAVAVSDPGIMFGTHPSINYWEPWYLGWHPRPWRKRGLITDDNPAYGLYPDLMRQNHDLHELHALLAPRPFLVSGGEVDPPERWLALNHLVRVNRLLGYTNRVGMTNRSAHEPSEESNEILYSFFEHFLKTTHN